MSRLPKRGPTLQDVAKAAGVSPATASHAIRKKAPVSPEAQERVRMAIEQLGYQPLAHKEPKRGRRAISVLINKNPTEYWRRCIIGLTMDAREAGYDVLVGDLRQLNAGDYFRSLGGRAVYGLVVFGTAATDEQLAQATECLPVVTVDRTAPGCGSVLSGRENGMRRLVRRLAASGYRNLGFLGADPSFRYDESLHQAFCRGLEESRLDLHPRWVHVTRMLRQNRADMAYELIQGEVAAGRGLPQVYICADDQIAAGAMRAIREYGREIPREAGIVGFGNAPFSPYLYLPLTTVDADAEGLGSACFEAIRQQIVEPDRPFQQLLLDTTLIVRSSVRL